jgi:DNA-binding PadR family transcriptional regulator
MPFDDNRPGLGPQRRQRRGRGWGDGCAQGQGPGQGQAQAARAPGEGRLLDEADLRLAVLAVLAEQPRTGIAAMQALAERGCAGTAASPAAVYPCLMLLQDTGLIAAAPNEAGRPVYTVTDAGAAELATQQRLAAAILADAADAARTRNPGRTGAARGGWRGRPRCCRRTAAAITASIGHTAPAAELTL